MTPQNEALAFAAVGFMLAFCVVLFVRSAVMLWHRMKFEYEYMQHPRLVPYNDAVACKDPHVWTTATLALRDLPPGQYQFCAECGVITGNEGVMLSKEVLKQVKEGLELVRQKMAAEAAITERVNSLADVYVEQFIAREFPEAKDLTFADRLRKLSDFTFEAQKLAAVKVAAEIEAQKELDTRYADWPGKIKGNA